jgi:hypothetical protein
MMTTERMLEVGAQTKELLDIRGYYLLAGRLPLDLVLSRTRCHEYPILIIGRPEDLVKIS